MNFLENLTKLNFVGQPFMNRMHGVYSVGCPELNICKIFFTNYLTAYDLIVCFKMDSARHSSHKKISAKINC